MKKILLFLLIIVLSLSSVPQLPASSEAPPATPPPSLEGPSPFPSSYMSDWLRDRNDNRIDDLIDEMPVSDDHEDDETLHIYVDYSSRPSKEDITRLGRFGRISYVCRYIPTVCVEDVKTGDISVIANLENVVMVEKQPLYKVVLDISTPAVKARDSLEYSPRTAWEKGYNGSGVNIAILDTGVDDGHPSLEGTFVAGADFTNPLGDRDGTDNPDDDNGHGSHVAGIALGRGGGDDDPDEELKGVAPGSGLIDVKVVTALGSGWGQNLIEALEWCQDNKDTAWQDAPSEDYHGIDVVSISLGNGEDDDGKSADARELNATVNAGIVVVAAAGNNNGNAINSPGSADRAITVGAVDDRESVDRDDDSIWSGSNHGPRADDGDDDPYDELKPDVVAPGVTINSCNYAVGGSQDPSSYVNRTGTSMATPHVAGLAAILLEADPTLIPTAVEEGDAEIDHNPIKFILHKTAEARGEPYNTELDKNYNTSYGWGIIDAYRAVREVVDVPDISVEGYELSDEKPNEGEDVIITVRLKELNNTAVAGSLLTFYMGEKHPDNILNETELALNASEEKEFNISWLAEKGEHEFIINVSSTEPEEDELWNNEMEFTVVVNEKPVARIKVNGETGQLKKVAPDENVEFDGSSSYDNDGDIQSYYFNFDDGHTRPWSSNPGTQHSFVNGEYDVELRVKDDNGAENNSFVTLIVNLPPAANAGENMEGQRSQELQFYGTATDDDEIALYKWDFEDDGNWDYSSDKNGNAMHSYSEIRTYLARFYVEDSHGEWDDDLIQVKIIAIGAPDVDAGDDGAVLVGKEIGFLGTASDEEGTIEEYAWDFENDGSWDYISSMSGETTHIYNEVGNYTAVFRATDDDGNENTDIRLVAVHRPPVSIISHPKSDDSYTTEDEIIFDGRESHDPDGCELNYLWNSDIDGNLSSSNYFSIKLSEGQHTINLTVTDENGENDVALISLLVTYYGNHAPVIIILSPEESAAYNAVSEIFFDASDSYDDDGDSLDVQWEYSSNGTVLSTKQTFYKKLPRDLYNITLKISDGHTLSKDTVEFIVSASPVSIIKNLKIDYDSREEITFDGSDSYDPDGDTLSFSWESSLDGALGDDEVLRTKLSDGEHIITLQVSDIHGFFAETMVTITVGMKLDRTLILDFLDEYSKEAEPYEECSFRFSLINEGETGNDITFDVTSLLYGWNISLVYENEALEDFTMTLSPFSESELKMVARLPNVRRGTTQEIDVTISSLDDRDLTVDFSVTIDVVERFSLELLLDVQELDFHKKDETKELSLRVRNTGNVDRQIYISLSGVDGYAFNLSKDVFFLDMNEETTIDIMVFPTRENKGVIRSQDLYIYVYSPENMALNETAFLTINTNFADHEDTEDDSPGFAFSLLIVCFLVSAGLTTCSRKRGRV